MKMHIYLSQSQQSNYKQGLVLWKTILFVFKEVLAVKLQF